MATLWRNTMKTLFATVALDWLSFEVEYIYIPAQQGKYSGPYEDCYPDEPEEIEFISIKLLKSPFNLIDVLSDDTIIKIEEILCTRHQSGELE